MRAGATRTVRVLPVLLLTGLLVACSDSAPTVTPPTPAGSAAAACEALDAQLPETVAGEATTKVSPDSPYTAAWGDIVLTCGGPAPKVPAGDQLFTIQGVDWYQQDLPAGGSRFTTVDRVATVSVVVPSTHSPEANAVVDLGPAVARTVLLTANTP